MKTRICASIMGETLAEMREKAVEALRLGADLVEFRLDSLSELDPSEIRKLASDFSSKCILTLRPRSQGGFYDGGEGEKLRVLREASRAKPAYVDLELGLSSLEILVRELRKNAGIIVSMHYGSMSEPDEVLTAASRAVEIGDIGKIVVTAGTLTDNAEILKIYRMLPEKRLVAFAMGESGIISRIISPMLGAPIAYACLPGEQAAPGQLTITEMKKFVDLMGDGF